MKDFSQSPAMQALLQTGIVIALMAHAANKNVLGMECINVKTLSALGRELRAAMPLDLQQVRKRAFLVCYVFTICIISDRQLSNCDLHPGNEACMRPC